MATEGKCPEFRQIPGCEVHRKVEKETTSDIVDRAKNFQNIAIDMIWFNTVFETMQEVKKCDYSSTVHNECYKREITQEPRFELQDILEKQVSGRLWSMVIEKAQEVATSRFAWARYDLEVRLMEEQAWTSPNSP
jgi:hypothetical protein